MHFHKYPVHTFAEGSMALDRVHAIHVSVIGLASCILLMMWPVWFFWRGCCLATVVLGPALILLLSVTWLLLSVVQSCLYVLKPFCESSADERKAWKGRPRWMAKRRRAFKLLEWKEES